MTDHKNRSSVTPTSEQHQSASEGATQGAVALDVRRTSDGRAWIAVDSVVDMLESMAGGMDDGPARSSLRTLAATFRPVSSYDEINRVASGDDGSQPRARRCACKRPVIDATTLSGSTLTVDADEADGGAWFVADVTEGRVRVAPYTQQMDGVSVVRLAVHECETP